MIKQNSFLMISQWDTFYLGDNNFNEVRLYLHYVFNLIHILLSKEHNTKVLDNRQSSPMDNGYKNIFIHVVMEIFVK